MKTPIVKYIIHLVPTTGEYSVKEMVGCVVSAMACKVGTLNECVSFVQEKEGYPTNG